VTDSELEPFFASDLAAEVRREYFSHTEHGIPTGEATHHVLATFRDLLDDPHDGPVVFLALAAMQIRDGYVLPIIRETALELINTGVAKRAYASSDLSITRQRKDLLASLLAALEAAEPTRVEYEPKGSRDREGAEE
jgi:hypothetical protein